MAKSGSKTNESLQQPLVRQFSVFLENKVGALLDLTRTLSDSNVHVCGISVVDTADASVVRIVVDDPERCHDALGKAGIAVKESDVVVVEMPRGPEKLDTVLKRWEENFSHNVKLLGTALNYYAATESVALLGLLSNLDWNRDWMAS